MQLIRHQSVKDLRQFRLGLVFWWGLLAMDLALNLLLPGWIEFDSQTGFSQGAAFVAGWVVFLLWLGALLLPAVVVMSDSPLRENAFVRTRPVPRRSIVYGKLWFIGWCMLAPACLTEVVHLLAAGAGVIPAVHAAAERLLFLALVVLAAAAFGGLWRTAKELVAGWLVFCGGAWVTFLVLYLVAAASEKLGLIPRWIDDPNASRLLVWECVLLLGLVFVVGRAWSGRLRSWRRWLALPVVTLAASLLGFFPSWDLFPVRPADRELVRRIQPDSMLPVEWGHFQVTSNADAAGDGVSVGGSLDPELPGVGGPVTVDWTVMDAAMELESGDRVGFDYTGRVGPVFGWRAGLSERDLRAFEPLLGGEALFFTDHGVVFGGGMANLGRALFDQMPTNRAHIRAGLKGRVFRWSTSARLPLRKGGLARDEAGTWAIVDLVTRGDQSHAVGLRRDQAALLTSSDATHRRLGYWPATRHEFLFVDTKRQTVFLQQSPVWRSLELGSHTGFAHYYLSIELRIPELLRSVAAPTDLEDLELWVLQRDFLGEVETMATTPQIDLTSLRPTSASEVNLLSEQDRDEAAVRRRMEAIPVPPEDASRAQVANHLVQVLRLVEARRMHVPEDDPIVLRLATLVPGHLELFLDALPYADHYSARVLRAALRHGTPEADAGELVAALPRDPDLAGVVLARGWEQLAAPLVDRLAEIPNTLPGGVTQLLVLSGKPGTRARLLADFEQRPSIQTYDIMRTLDGFEPDLQVSLDVIWRERPRAIRSDADSTRLGILLRTGSKDALVQVLRVFHLVPQAHRDQLWSLLDACREALVMEGIDHSKRYDHGALAVWLEDKQPDDFEWDAHRRRWVLPSSLSANAQP